MMIQLIVGLGNPGTQYQNTRHNVGFWMVDEIASTAGATWQLSKKHQAYFTKITLGAQTVYLLKPNTMMNNSGISVQSFLHFYRIPLENMLVIHDELDFEVAAMRFKASGGHGGHNGLRNIMQQLSGAHTFWRLRIGIGHPGNADKVTSYVLSQPSSLETTQLKQSIAKILPHIPDFVSGHQEKVIEWLHTKE